MTDDERQLESLRAVSAQASLLVEGSLPYVLLPATRLTTAGGVEVMNTVLCPRGQGGYVTRLLLERRATTAAGLNWQTVVALGVTWHTWSWNLIPANLPWLQILAEHARLLR